MNEREPEFADVIQQGIELQQKFSVLKPVAVGGTAAALHCRHRFSLDVDCVTPLLQQHYDEIAEALEQWDGWRTNRKNPPVLILGEREGVQLGLRQQRRPIPLRTQEVQGLRVPTPSETLRIKAFLLQERRGTRDYVDIAALMSLMGEEKALQALSYLNLLYAARGGQSTLSRFAEACEAEPADINLVDLSAYKGLHPPFTDWEYVAQHCRTLGRQLIKAELREELPRDLNSGYLEGEALS